MCLFKILRSKIQDGEKIIKMCAKMLLPLLLISHYAFAINDMNHFPIGLDPTQLQLNDAHPTEIMKMLLAQSGLPFPNKPIRSATLTNFSKVKSQSMNPSTESTGFLAYSMQRGSFVFSRHESDQCIRLSYRKVLSNKCF